jgi:hypothetical protein
MHRFVGLCKIRMKCRAGLTLFALTVGSAQADAQGVTGVISDQETRLPIAGALVTLRDSVERVAGRVLSDGSGRFAWRAQPGRYRLEVEHIGYHKTTRPIETPLTGFATADFQIDPAPIALDQIRVEARSQCRQASDPQTARVWYLAKTALGSAAVTTLMRRLHVRTYVRDRDISLKAVGDERVEFETRRGVRAFQAASVDSLLAYGFVQSQPQGELFYGPDVEVLLSDKFVDVHCFRVTRTPQRAGLVGLEFWPGDRGPVRGIRGVMWIEERTGVLQFVEYSYTGLAAELDPRLAGGRVDFFPADAGWLVRSWYIRTPRYAEVSTGGRLHSTVVGARETGAEIVRYDPLRSDSSIARGTISGIVYDSIKGEPLGNAFVYASGTSYRTQTGKDGAFQLDSIPVGDYYVSFDHPALTRVPAFVALQRVHVIANDVVRTELTVPSEATLQQRICTAEQMAQSSGVLQMKTAQLAAITGKVRRGHSGVPYARVQITSYPQWVETDAQGDFVLCGIPRGLDLEFTVTISHRIVARKLVRAIWRRVARVDLPVP